MERLLQDIRFALRLLVRERAFSLTAVLTLAVCVGANAAIFAIVNSVLLRPLPFAGSDRLVHLYNSYPNAGVLRASTGVPDYYDRLREMDVFEELALYQQRGVTIGSTEGAERVTGLAARPSLFRMLHAQPLRGRIFSEDEGEIGNHRKVILSERLWRRMFGGREDAVGQDLRVNGVPYQIVGVMPARFYWMNADVSLWMPLGFTAEEKSDDARHNNSWTMVGLLKPGASVTQAQQQVDALNGRNLERFPGFKQILINAGFHTVATSLQQDLVREIRPSLFLLWGGVLFMLAIGAVNIANLVMIRSTARMRELATRHALGAGLSRLTTQLLTETVLLTLVGGALGVALGYGVLSVLSGGALEALPRSVEVRLDAPVVLFTVALAVAVGLLVGIMPVWSMRRLNLSQAFRDEGRSGTSGRGARLTRQVLVAGQVAFAVILLVGAGVLFASFRKVLAVDAGFEPSNLLTARVSPPASRYADQAAVRALASRLLETVRTLPGVTSAGEASHVPFGEDFDDSVILAEGYQMAPGESLISPYRMVVSPGYFETLHVPLKHGRFFSEGDTLSSEPVVIVDEALARKFWPGQDPVGRRMYQPDNPENLLTPSPNQRYLRVIGVVGDTRMAGLVTSDTRAGTYYFPMSQAGFRTMNLVVRSTGDPLALTGSIRGALLQIDRELPLYSTRTMQQRIDGTLADRRTPMLLAIAFGAVSLLLAAMGLYGVLAYQVAQRRREIGIRMALGSEPRGIFALVLREGMALLAVGTLAGLGGAYATGRAIQSQLYGVTAMEPAVVGTVVLLLAAVATLACTLPARRAAKTDPTVALAD